MIYLDNAATTSPKPMSVRSAAAEAMRLSANPGRSGHDLSLRASEEIYRARKAAAAFFHADKPMNVIFTLNCTTAVNLVLKGLLRSGDHVVVSDLEHNAVMRPLHKLQEKGISYSVAAVVAGDNDSTVNNFRRAINAHTRMIVCTHASNVWGIRLPVERLAVLAHEYGLLIAVDAAQSAGVLPIDLADSRIDYLCVAGHKGLYGPMGTGMLIVNSTVIPDTLTEGGTGSHSLMTEQPEELPDKLESGTPNVSGIAGLRAGIEFVARQTAEAIAQHEFMLIQRLYRGLAADKRIQLYVPEPKPPDYVPLLSFNIKDTDSETAAQALNRSGFAVRAGLHCSPMAHRKMATEEIGAIRVSPSYFTQPMEIDRFLARLPR